MIIVNQTTHWITKHLTCQPVIRQSYVSQELFNRAAITKIMLIVMKVIILEASLDFYRFIFENQRKDLKSSCFS